MLIFALILVESKSEFNQQSSHFPKHESRNSFKRRIYPDIFHRKFSHGEVWFLDLFPNLKCIFAHRKTTQWQLLLKEPANTQFFLLLLFNSYIIEIICNTWNKYLNLIMFSMTELVSTGKSLFSVFQNNAITHYVFRPLLIMII